MYLPKIGSTCLFTLTSKFSSLNGIYKVAGLGFFNDMAVNVNFVDNLYTPAGLTQQDYINDFNSYKNTNVAIVNPVDSATTTYYFPEPIIAKVPDPTVEKYQNVYFGILIGLWKENKQDNTLKALASQIQTMVTATVGTTNSVRILANPQNDQYLTASQYAVIQEQRQANIQSQDTLYTQLQNALALNNTYQAKIAALEEIIINMSQSSQPTGSKKGDVQDT